jgi:hypothetical protein
MTKVKLVSAALIAAAMLAAPAMARESHVKRTTPAAHYVGGRACVPAPAVGAFATQPWDNSSPPCEPATVY